MFPYYSNFSDIQEENRYEKQVNRWMKEPTPHSLKKTKQFSLVVIGAALSFSHTVFIQRYIRKS